MDRIDEVRILLGYCVTHINKIAGYINHGDKLTGRTGDHLKDLKNTVIMMENYREEWQQLVNNRNE